MGTPATHRPRGSHCYERPPLGCPGHSGPSHPSPRCADIFAASTLADQLAVAIENSRLYEHADELAAVVSANGWRRDLPDAVSQTLFSVSLIAEVLPRMLRKDQDQGRERLEELRLLTRGPWRRCGHYCWSCARPPSQKPTWLICSGNWAKQL